MFIEHGLGTFVLEVGGLSVGARRSAHLKAPDRRWRCNSKVKAGGSVSRNRLEVLCIDNHASSNYACFLLARSGYKVNSASFFCDALELIHGSSYDVCPHQR
mgnify:CR=1 FL=1